MFTYTQFFEANVLTAKGNNVFSLPYFLFLHEPLYSFQWFCAAESTLSPGQDFPYKNDKGVRLTFQGVKKRGFVTS